MDRFALGQSSCQRHGRLVITVLYSFRPKKVKFLSGRSAKELKNLTHPCGYKKREGDTAQQQFA